MLSNFSSILNPKSLGRMVQSNHERLYDVIMDEAGPALNLSGIALFAIPTPLD